MHQIRPLAICVFRHQDRILVAEGYDSVKDQRFYRPLGGGIEFGEYSAQTIQRELLEEIGAEVSELKLLGTLENVFVFNGTPGHEIVQVYDGSFKDTRLYQQTAIVGRETDLDGPFHVMWKHLDEFGEVGCILYPTGLLDLLR